jgi:glutaredoxin 2
MNLIIYDSCPGLSRKRFIDGVKGRFIDGVTGITTPSIVHY